MSMDFGNVAKLVIPEGEVSMIASGETVLWRKQRLPQLYQETEYISAAQDQAAYIDLGITYDQGCTCEIRLIYNGAADFWGVFQNDGKRARLNADSGNKFAFNVGYDSSTATNARTESLIVGESYTLKSTAKNSNVRMENITTGHIDEIAINPNFIIYTCTENIYLLGWKYRGAPRTIGIRTVKGFKYWDKDGNLLRDMIPCYRRSDNVIGMFDLVSQAFFTNAGTGAFTKGGNADG